MKIGDTFSSFEELEHCFQKYKEENYVDFYVSDSRILEKAKKSCPKRLENVPEELKYYYIKYQCVHGGRFKKKKTSIGARETSTLKHGCEAFIYVNIEDISRKLIISKMSDVHNHQISKALFQQLPKQRRIAPDVKQEVLELLDLQANKKLIQEKVQKETGCAITLRDISNIAATGKEKSHNNIEEVVHRLQKKHNSSVELCADNDNNFLGVFIQDNQMKESFEAFPEILFADSTYKLLDLKIPVFVLLVEDGNGQSEVAAIGLLVHENETILTWFFETFQKLNPACNQTKVIMTDKDLTERAVIKKVFSHVRLRICLFHTQKSFNRESTCEKMGISPSQRDLAREYFQKLCYAKNMKIYDEIYDHMKSVLPTEVVSYFNTNWHTIRAEWSAAAAYNIETFFNTTNNRLESLNGKMKSVIRRFSTLEEFTDKFFVFIKCIRSERNACAAKLIQKFPTKEFITSDDRQYHSYLTPYAFSFVEKQLLAARNLENSNVDCEYVVTDKSCTCIFRRSMQLPCKHIFFYRKKSELPVFDTDLCDKRWSRTYYIKKHRVFQNENSESLVSDITEPDQSTEISIMPPEKVLTTHQKFRKASVLTSKLATIASESSNIHFERKMHVLETLLDCWSKGKEVGITESTESLNVQISEMPDHRSTGKENRTTEMTESDSNRHEIRESLNNYIYEIPDHRSTGKENRMTEMTESDSNGSEIRESLNNHIYEIPDHRSTGKKNRMTEMTGIAETLNAKFFEIPDCESTGKENKIIEMAEINSNIIKITECLSTQNSEMPVNVADTQRNLNEVKSDQTNVRISIKDIKLPTKVVMRGRPRGAMLTTIGLPKRQPRALRPVAFCKKHYTEREKILLSWFVTSEVIEKVRKENHLISENEVECRPEKIHCGILDSNVDINEIRKYFSIEGWETLQSVLKCKRKKCVWVCPICQTNIGRDRSIGCDSCLSWFHFKCAAIVVEPKRKVWFCHNCYAKSTVLH